MMQDSPAISQLSDSSAQMIGPENQAILGNRGKAIQSAFRSLPCANRSCVIIAVMIGCPVMIELLTVE